MKPKRDPQNRPWDDANQAEKKKRNKKIAELKKRKEEVHEDFQNLHHILQEGDAGKRMVSTMRFLKEQINDLKRGGSERDALNRRRLQGKIEKDLIRKPKNYVL